MRVPLFCLRFLTPQIHNFSNYNLSCSERYLLSLGLNFRPTSKVLSIDVLNHQFDDFVRSVRIKHFFTIKVLFVHVHHNIVNYLLNHNGSLQGVLHGLRFRCLPSDLSCILYIIAVIITLLIYLVLNFSLCLDYAPLQV